MKLYLVFVVLLAIVPLSAQPQLIKDLGERTPECTNILSDDYEWDPHPALMQETKKLVAQDKLKQLLIPGGTCLRVGTEINITNLNDSHGLLGRALVDSIETLSAQELKRRKLPYSAEAVQTFIQATKQSEYVVVSIDITEKISETVVKKKYARLNTCFPMFSDWSSFRLPQGVEGKTLALKIQSGQIVATIRNGVLNCYKVGKYAPLELPAGTTTDLGGVKIKELHLIHYTNLNETHAQLLGQNLSTLKKEMKENSSIDGGYTNMTVFEYQEPDNDVDTNVMGEE